MRIAVILLLLLTLGLAGQSQTGVDRITPVEYLASWLAKPPNERVPMAGKDWSTTPLTLAQVYEAKKMLVVSGKKQRKNSWRNSGKTSSSYWENTSSSLPFKRLAKSQKTAGQCTFPCTEAVVHLPS